MNNVVLIKKSGLTVIFQDPNLSNAIARAQHSIEEAVRDAAQGYDSPVEKIFISCNNELKEYALADIERLAFA